LPAVCKQEDPELLTSFRDTFWHVPSSYLLHLCQTLSFNRPYIHGSTGVVAYRFNTSCRITGVGLSNSVVVERPIPACTSRPAVARYVQIRQRSREPAADSRSRTTPKMFGIQASNVCGAGAVSMFTLQVQQLAACDSDAKTHSDLLDIVCWIYSLAVRATRV
jgi:hypothetical protein